MLEMEGESEIEFSYAWPCDDESAHGRECVTKTGQPGLDFCLIIDGESYETRCLTDYACVPADSGEPACGETYCAWNGETLVEIATEVDEDDCTPLVVVLDGAPVRFEAASAASFDISAVGSCMSTDWPSHPWLAIDRDGDGVIEDGRELFGSGTRIAGGGRARDGFAALAELDADRDGKITPADPAFAALVLWTDHDGDRRGTLDELEPVAALGLLSFDLDPRSIAECDARGNCSKLRSSVELQRADGSRERGALVDVFLPCQ